MHTVLFVDDNTETLESYKRMFQRQTSRWKPFFADNAGEAMDIIDSRTVDILITDLEMPVVDGIALLREVQNSSPLTIRVLLSGCTDSTHVMESAKLAHQIFPKPSCFKEINELLEHAVYIQGIRLSKSARLTLTKLGTIPALPSVIAEIIEAASKEDFSLREISTLIAKDLGTSANILRLINSPYFAMNHKITSVEQAVSLLGLDIIKPLIITVHFFESFGALSKKLMEDLLKHSTTSGRFCRALFQSENRSPAECDRAFIAGFMHDIGRVILMNISQELYLDAVETAKRERCGTDAAEMRLMQTTHAELSAFMLGLWGFDDQIIEAVHFHHSPSKARCSDPLLLAVLHSADLFECEINEDPLFLGCDTADELFLEKNGLLDKQQAWFAVCLKENSR